MPRIHAGQWFCQQDLVNVTTSSQQKWQVTCSCTAVPCDYNSNAIEILGNYGTLQENPME